jgi:hypothetical protein
MVEFDITRKPTSKNQKYKTAKHALLLLDETPNQRIPVASSNIATVGYDIETQILEIEFHHGAINKYVNVPEEVYEELMNSPAKGSFFMNEIKGKFELVQ